MKKTKNKRTILIVSAIVVVLAVAGYFLFRGEKGPTFETVAVERGDVTQEVSVTGTVKPAEDVYLSFENGGKVSRIYADVGDKVRVGDILIQLDNSEINAQLAGAQAALETQEAELAELKAGSRAEEINVKEAEVSSAEAALDQAKKSLVGKLQNAYTVSDDAVHNRADSFFRVPPIPAPHLVFSIADIQLKIDIESRRLALESALASWQSSLGQLTATSDLAYYISVAKTNLDQVSSFLNKANLALNGLTGGAEISQTTIDAWKTGIATARTNVSASIDDVSGADTTLSTKQSALELAQQELNLTKAGSTKEEIDAQQAQVNKARADVLNYEAQMEKTIIRSPMDGLVTKQDAKVGEIVSANENLVSVISANNFEIEANIPEADIAKVKLGDPARITLDAYGEDVVFGAKVVKIDPAETVIEGVSTYKTTLQFDMKDERIKSGMTANMDIMTDKRKNVVVIPQRAVISRGQDKFVLVDNGTINPEERKIETGLRGVEGNVEVISGLMAGERISAYGSNK